MELYIWQTGDIIPQLSVSGSVAAESIQGIELIISK